MSSALDQARQSPLPGELRAGTRLRRQSQQHEPPSRALHTPQRAPSTRSARRLGWRLVAAGAATTLLLAATLHGLLPSGEDAALSADASVGAGLDGCGHDCSAEEALADARRQAQQLRAEQARLAKAAAEAGGLRAELRQQRQDAAALAKQAKGADAAASRLRGELQAAQDTLAAASEQLQVLERANGELRGQAAGAVASQRELARLRSDLQAAQEQAQRAGEAGAAAEERLQRCNQRLDDSQALVRALGSRTDSCWQAAERAKEATLRWQLRSAGASAAVLLLCGLLAAGYRRHLQRQVWRLTTEKGRLSAALRLAQTGLGERLQSGRR